MNEQAGCCVRGVPKWVAGSLLVRYRISLQESSEVAGLSRKGDPEPKSCTGKVTPEHRGLMWNAKLSRCSL